MQTSSANTVRLFWEQENGNFIGLPQLGTHLVYRQGWKHTGSARCWTSAGCLLSLSGTCLSIGFIILLNTCYLRLLGTVSSFLPDVSSYNGEKQALLLKTGSLDHGVSLLSLHMNFLPLREREYMQVKAFFLHICLLWSSSLDQASCVSVRLYKFFYISLVTETPNDVPMSSAVSGIILFFSLHGPASVGGLISLGFSLSLV